MFVLCLKHDDKPLYYVLRHLRSVSKLLVDWL